MTEEEIKEELFQKLLEEVKEKNYCKAMRYCDETSLLEDASYIEKLKQLPAGNTNFYVYALAMKWKDVKKQDLAKIIAFCEKEEYQEEGKLQLVRVKCLIKCKDYDTAIAICDHFITYEGFFLQKLKCLFLQKRYDEILMYTKTPQYQKDYLVEEYRIKALMKKREFSKAYEETKQPYFKEITTITNYQKNLQNYLAFTTCNEEHPFPNQERYAKMLEEIFIGDVTPEEINHSSFFYYEKVLFTSFWHDVFGGSKSKKDLEECGTLFCFSSETKRRVKKKQNHVDFLFYRELFLQLSNGYQYIFRQIEEFVQNNQLEKASKVALLYQLSKDFPDLLDSISKKDSQKEFLLEKKETPLSF